VLVVANLGQAILWRGFLSLSTDVAVNCLGEVQDDETKIEEIGDEKEEDEEKKGNFKADCALGQTCKELHAIGNPPS
jgi:hypothetical protein